MPAIESFLRSLYAPPSTSNIRIIINSYESSCEELTHWKRLWHWEGLGAGGEGDDRGRDGWMASPTRWTWVWVNSGSWWWTGRPGMLQFMGSQRVGHNWGTELNWTDECLLGKSSLPVFLPGESHGQRRQAGYSLSLVQFSHSVVSDSL